ncbi:hypothetical protein GCM10025876_09200 [Demequina litorisediminis]|uniref:Uncharacterized protein n=1 Tax=Demequina litorisediminis TaxID=1849022 RepID=A0ABQ6IB88_9MICO|nr:hypothetical protein GCM10025876_09200 [Demequina litorisediminis]
MGLRVFSAMSDLKIAVEVGLVTGVIPAMTPTGSAISVMPSRLVLVNDAHGLHRAHGVGDVLAREDVLHGLVFEDATAGLGDRLHREVAVLAERRDRRLLDQHVNVFLGERGVCLQGTLAVRDESVDLGRDGRRGFLDRGFLGGGHGVSLP